MSVSASRRDASPQLVLVIVCAGVVLASLDLFIVNVALPEIGRDPLATLIAYQRATWMIAAIAIIGLGLLAVKRQPSPTADGETIAPAVAIVASGEAPRA